VAPDRGVCVLERKGVELLLGVDRPTTPTVLPCNGPSRQQFWLLVNRFAADTPWL
jgi:hypothetical protein